jgi:hypothetical protein
MLEKSSSKNSDEWKIWKEEFGRGWVRSAVKRAEQAVIGTESRGVEEVLKQVEVSITTSNCDLSN